MLKKSKRNPMDLDFDNPQDQKITRLRNDLQTFLEDHQTKINKKEKEAFKLVSSVLTDLSWRE